MTTLLHIGYHKTGSTWLQKNLFVNGRFGLQCLGTRLINQWFVDERQRDFSYKRVRLVVETAFGETRAKARVVSEERLSGHPYSGGYDSLEIAGRLAEVFPGAKVLIVVREQREMIRSCFSQYVRNGGVESISDFMRGRLDNFYPRFELEFYEYSYLVEVYRRLFGQDEVLVLPFELLKDGKLEFVNQILEFLELELVQQEQVLDWNPANKSPGDFQLEMLRRSNKFDGQKRRSINVGALDIPVLRRMFRLAARVAGQLPRSWNDDYRMAVKRKICERVDGFYSRSNLRLGEMVHWKPEEFGYQID